MKTALFIAALFVGQLCTAQTSAGRYMKSANSGCLVWNENYSPGDSVLWTGSCKKKYAEGNGVLTWFVNNTVHARYEGEMKMGQPNGKGIYVFTDWCSMEGDFVNGILHGYGKITYVEGAALEGRFVNGSLLKLNATCMAALKKNNLQLRDTSSIYISDADSDTLYYYSIVPQITPVGVLALFPATYETTENVISCNQQLIEKAFEKGMMTIVISANYNRSMESDPLSLVFFNQVFSDAIVRYKAPPDKFILSGFSLGGNNALHYTEMSRDKRYITSIRPLAVIAVDPPVDCAGLYRRAENEIAVYARDTMPLSIGKQGALSENHYIINYYNTKYGGSPDKKPAAYIEGSEFSYDQPDGGNAKYLLNVPVRIYCDPDIVWQLENRSRSYYGMNAADQAAMINFLRINGNTKAEFIPAIGKGYRLDGTRHPHSWSVIDPDECLNWMLSLLAG
ncbi:MAG: hypothetical protein ACRC3B_15005 [Bacteroidia bacterium]